MGTLNRSTNADWPPIPYAEWRETCATLHLWTQVVGKVRLMQTPWTNHSWHVALYVTARGLGTSLIPHGARAFAIDFDFLGHELVVQATDGARRTLALRPRSVADFYHRVRAALEELGLKVEIRTLPCEIADGIPFEEDEAHRHYDADAAQRFWRALLQIQRVFHEFRSRFVGKCSPVHFFWGSFDLAVTRFSGREAPPHPGGVPSFPDWAAREAYSHEVSSAGFWPGGGGADDAAFYSYAYPKPEGFERAAVRPAEARYSKELGEFLLDYETVRQAASPDEVLLDFLESTYAAAADLGRWDRAGLERRSFR